MTQEEVGEVLGLSGPAVAYIEQMALWKISHRIKQLDSLIHPLDRFNSPDTDQVYADPAND